jgi:response regulator RpfG family c-di-GMP phosphodiesterase
MNSTKKLKHIISLDSELNKIKDVDILLERILTEARKVVNADAGSIYKKHGEIITIHFTQNETLQSKLKPGEKLPFSSIDLPIDRKTISGYVAATGESVNIEDLYSIHKDEPYSYNTQYDKMSGYKCTSNLTVPLKTAQGRILGVIQIINAKNRKGEIVPFSKDDELVINHFAANATVALERAQMTRALLLRMISMAELRDPKETGPHVNRVAGYAVEIFEGYARKHNFDEQRMHRERDNLRIAAMLHDVGKVAISDLILKKPARFSEGEYKIMQSHTLHGAKLFQDSQSDVDEMAAAVAFSHHENWDGTGYPGHIDPYTGEVLKADDQGHPLGKSGEEIPLWARIVSLADVYDALSCKRVYKDAWSQDDVLEAITAEKGKKFDPELVEIFFNVYSNILNIAKRYKD